MIVVLPKGLRKERREGKEERKEGTQFSVIELVIVKEKTKNSASAQVSFSLLFGSSASR
jgi:hypothetical protein